MFVILTWKRQTIKHNENKTNLPLFQLGTFNTNKQTQWKQNKPTAIPAKKDHIVKVKSTFYAHK